MGTAAMQHHNHRAHGGSSGGSSFSVPLLAVAATLATALILWLSDTTATAAQRVDCNAFSSFLDRRATHAHVTQLITDAGPSLADASKTAAAAAAAGPGLDPATASALGGVAADAMRRVGWRATTKYARFDPTATLDAVLERPSKHTGSFLLIVPGDGSPQRRSKRTPFFSINPAAAGLPAVLGPAAAALNTAVGVLEASLGRRLFSFHLESAPLPACAAGSGPCAVWEASSGRLVLDSWLAGKIAAGGGQAAAAAAAAGEAGGHKPSPTLVNAATITGAAAGEAELAAAAAAGDGASGPADEAAADTSGSSSDGSSSGGSGDLANLLAAFVDLLAGQVAEASSLLQKGKASLPALAAIFAKAGAASVTLLMAAQVPLWWCIVCPMVLGMLAPFIFNFGLTAAAEALCSQLQLPDDTCSDLWWGAFAVALMLSLASAIPIVYLCRLPECGRHGVAAAAAVLAAAAARMTAA